MEVVQEQGVFQFTVAFRPQKPYALSVRDGEPAGTATSTFTQLLSSDFSLQFCFTSTEIVLSPFLNGRSICLPNILRTVRRTDSFLN